MPLQNWLANGAVALLGVTELGLESLRVTLEMVAKVHQNLSG